MRHRPPAATRRTSLLAPRLSRLCGRWSLFAPALYASGCASSPVPTPAPLSPPSADVAEAAPAKVPSPLIVVDATDVRLDGERVGDVAELEREGKPHRIDDLFARIHDGAAANHDPKGWQVWFDLSKADALPAVDALLTAAFASSMKVVVHLKTARGWFSGHWDPLGHHREAARRLLVRQESGSLALAFQSEESCDAVPESTALPPSALSAYLDGAAPKRHPIDSLHLSVAAGVPFAQVLDVLDTLGDHASAGRSITVSLADADAKPLERTCGRAVPANRPSPATIQAVVRAHFGPMRACYEQGLKRTPTLTGKVTVRFVIPRDGHVVESTLDEVASSMPDPGVSACVVAEFGRLTFPPPDGGKSTVVYPIVFSPQE